MEKSNEKLIYTSYTDIYKYNALGEYEKVLKACNKCKHHVCYHLPYDSFSMQCKAITLIQLSKFQEALFILQDSLFLGEAKFEIAYCLYRLDKLEQSLKILDSITDVDIRANELKAQIVYRLDKYEEALQIYLEINKTANDEYDEERKTNLSAVLASLEDKTKVHSYLQLLKEDTYELCYNKALVYVNKESYGSAEKILRKSEKLCREFFEEDGLEEEVEAELLNVKVFLGYIFQKQGRIKDAQQLYSAVLKEKGDNVVLTAIASNNSATINKDENIFDTKKKLKVATNESLEAKLQSKQLFIINLNNAIYHHYIGLCEASNKICGTININWPDSLIETKVLSMMNYHKMQKDIELMELIKNTNEEHLSNHERMYIKLSKAHLYLLKDRKSTACNILYELMKQTYKPGLVGALITLYLSMGKDDLAVKIFEETVEWYRQHKVSGSDLTNLWKQAAEFHMKNERFSTAAKSLEELVAENPTDLRSVARLVIAYGMFSKGRAFEVAERLGKFNDLECQVDVNVLESPIWLTTKKGTLKTDPTSPVAIHKVEKKKCKSHRKSKLPKNYRPDVTPDPERWLPRYERIGYKKKKERRGKASDVPMKGSQGVSSVQADQFDFSSKTSTENDSPSISEVNLTLRSFKTRKSATSNLKRRGGKRR